jgi:crossover junction endodeoxyribonuclease RusA
VRCVASGPLLAQYTLPFPVSTNALWGVGGGRVYLTKAARKFNDGVAQVIGSTPPHLTGPLDVMIELYMPDRRRRDTDNYVKSLHDALTKANVWGDDKQVVDVFVRAMGVEKPGRCEVSIYRGVRL